jgi:regulator of sirC expression with transglutaminase-like and TPR domain
MKNAPSSSNERPATNIDALLHLLSDRDPRIARQIHQHLVDAGSEALPLLREALRNCDEPFLATRIRAAMGDSNQADVERHWDTLLKTSEHELDLEDGAFLIARTGDPEMETTPYQQRLDDMAAELHPLSSGTPRQVVRHMNEYLFQTLRFRGNTEQYYDLNNSFLHRVLDNRVGIPISLSVVYLLLGQRLCVPVAGIGLPGHFLVGLRTEAVFIDCFHQGTLLTDKDCARLLQNHGVEFDRRYLEPCSHAQILARMLRNLIAVYETRQETTKGRRFRRLLTALENREHHPHVR